MRSKDAHGIVIDALRPADYEFVKVSPDITIVCVTVPSTVAREIKEHASACNQKHAATDLETC